MLSNFEDTIYLAATSRDLKQYWIDQVQQVIKKLKADAKLEDKPVLLNNPKPVSLETRMERYRASVRKREMKEAGMTPGKGNEGNATMERGSRQRGSVKTRGRGTQTAAGVGAAAGMAGAGMAMASGGRGSARRNDSQKAKGRRHGSKKQGSSRQDEQRESEYTEEEQSETGSLSADTGGVGGRKKFR